MLTYNRIPTEKLVEILANAYVTYAQCGGHSKADQNARICSEIRKELKIRKVYIPSNDELSEKGKFNGEGSY